MNLKKLILAISGLGIAAMLFVCVDFYIEKNKPVHMAGMQSSKNEIKTAFQPAGESGQEQAQTTTQNNDMNVPKLGANTMLPENIPPAMLKAMQERGMSIEDLQKSNPNMQQTMPAMPKGKAFPKEMLEAMEKQKQEQQNQEQSVQTAPADPVEKAAAHIKGHNDEALNKHLDHTLAALKENPSDETALASITEIFLAHNEAKGAEILLQKGIVAAPNSAMLPFLYGQVLAQNSEYEKTAEQWERALSLQESAELHYSLGMLYRYQLNKEDAAKEHFQKAKTLPQHDERLAEHLKIELEK